LTQLTQGDRSMFTNRATRLPSCNARVSEQLNDSIIVK
jgi:hypothetical protein